jgi:SAM-dependent methyltransferase
MTHISQKHGQFRYFDIQLRYPAWGGRKVLDFGGNVGNLLRDPESAIDEADYWCIDVSREALAQGRRDFPRAHWIFYDCYNYCFNPTGRKGLRLPETGQKFDYILAYSVFTHLVPSEMRRLLDDLLAALADDGVLAFSFIDPGLHAWPGEYRGDNFRWRLDSINRDGLKVDTARAARIVKDAPWFILADDAHVWIATERFRTPLDRRPRPFHVYHAPEYIRALYPQAEILPPANREMQHCCIIRKNGFTP